jgi:hypothetical protein
MAQLNVFQKEPNIYITEAASPPPTPSGGPLGVGAMFGVAEWGPVGVATPVYSFAEWQRIFGGYVSATYPSYKQVKKFFLNGGQTLYFTRVVHYTTITDPGTYTSVKALATLVDASSAARLLVKGKYTGAKGNSLRVELEVPTLGVSGEFKMSVKLDGALIEPPYDNMSLDTQAVNYVKRAVEFNSNWIEIVEGSSVANLSIALNTLVTLVGGTNGLTTLGAADYIGDSIAQNGIAAFNIVEEPLLIACPDAAVTTAVSIPKEIGRWCDNTRVLNFGILAVPASHSPVAAISFVSSTLSLDSPRCAIYYPWILDEDDGTYISPEGAIMGVYARFANDTGKGVWWSPAGMEANLYGVAGVEYKVASDAAGRLNEKSVNCLKITPSGVNIWGGRTLAIAKVADFKYIGPRLNTSNIEYLISRNTSWAVLRPNDEMLWMQLKSVIDMVLRRRFLDGGLDGKKASDAFSIVCDDTVNTQAQKTAGIVVCQIGIRNKQTAEFLWFNIAQLGTGAQITE